jgi:Taurine catabolism dioxygenase TauD, TfdA family
VFTRWGERLFVRLNIDYILSSQRHADAPRLTDRAREALDWLRDAAQNNRFSVTMDFRPGDMQFVNNHHVLHGRTPCVDEPATGKVRHLKRLWLESEVLVDRPPQFINRRGYWNEKPSLSRLDAPR